MLGGILAILGGLWLAMQSGRGVPPATDPAPAPRPEPASAPTAEIDDRIGHNGIFAALGRGRIGLAVGCPWLGWPSS